MFFLRDIRWQDTLDIVIATYVLFRVYILFRGTYVFRVITGLAILWVFQQVAVYLGLIVTGWAIKSVTALAAFIVVVIFRNELRDILQVKNIRAFLWGRFKKPLNTPVETIVDSAFELSEKRIGALMVFMGNEDGEQFVKNKIPWQGNISREMILSVFWRDNPVHDGAAIFREDIITDVGVILPLSQREDLPSCYGTRHRAALGLTEKTDSMVIVVSEERGKVTVAKGGELMEVKNKKELTESIHRQIGEFRESKNTERRELLKHAGAVLVSAIFVVSLWLSFVKGYDTFITMEVPIEYNNPKTPMEISSTSVNSINLHLKGSSSLIKSIMPDQVQVKLDLTNATIGKNVFTITRTNVTLPTGIELKTASPQKVEVILDVLTSKVIPVQVDFAGKLPKYLLMQKIKITPEKVKIRGASQLVEKISTIYTQKVQLDSLEESGKLSIDLLLITSSLKLASGNSKEVVVEYWIKRR